MTAPLPNLKDIHHPHSVAWWDRLNALGYRLLDPEHGHWSMKGKRPDNAYHDLVFHIEAGWHGERFDDESTGSSWVSPWFPEPEAAHVYCEVALWGEA